MESRRIVVPSRERARLMPQLLALVPDATLYVHEREADAYRATCGDAPVVTHKVDTGIIDVRNAMLHDFEEDCIIMLDDDLLCVHRTIGDRKTKITDPDDIRAIINNGHQCAVDVDASVFSWSAVLSPVHAQFSERPFRLVQPIVSPFGLRGSSRYRRFDAKCQGRGDYDYTFQVLLEDRIIFADMRFHFDHGGMFTQAGGNTGRVTQADKEAAEQRLRAKWGDMLVNKNRRKKAKYVPSMSVNVQRNNPAALRI